MKKNIIYLKSLLLFVSFCACSSNSEDDMQNSDPITYTNDVKAIIDGNCLNCHSDPPTNEAPTALVTYNQVRNSTENGTLISRIQRQMSESGAMPIDGPRLSQSLIDVIVQWRADGFIE